MNQEEEDTNTRFIMSYAENTKKTCACTATAMVLTVLFIMSPLKDFILTSIFSKIIIALLLFYSIYKNTVITTALKNHYDVEMMNGSTDSVKMNVLCGYTFSVFLTFLFLSVLYR